MFLIIQFKLQGKFFFSNNSSRSTVIIYKLGKSFQTHLPVVFTNFAQVTSNERHSTLFPAQPLSPRTFQTMKQYQLLHLNFVSKSQVLGKLKYFLSFKRSFRDRYSLFLRKKKQIQSTQILTSAVTFLASSKSALFPASAITIFGLP